MPRNKMLDLGGLPDCIALSDYGRCNRLNVFYCQGDKCPFKRSQKEDIDSIKYSYQRLSTLDSLTQNYIAEKYFNGSMPWKEKKSV